MEQDDRYPGLDFKASEMSAFAVALDIFIIALKNQNEKLVRFTPEDPKRFREWLNAHNVRDVNKEQKPAINPPDIKPKRRRFF